MQNGEQLRSVIDKLTEYLLKKNLFQDFKKEYGHDENIIGSLQPQKKKKKKPKKKVQSVKEQQQLQSQPPNPKVQPSIQQPPLPAESPSACIWLQPVLYFQQFMKGQYYMFEQVFYKLKSAKLTRFQFSYRIDAINTKTSKREEVFVSNSKEIYWVSTRKMAVQRLGDRYVVKVGREGEGGEGEGKGIVAGKGEEKVEVKEEQEEKVVVLVREEKNIQGKEGVIPKSQLQQLPKKSQKQPTQPTQSTQQNQTNKQPIKPVQEQSKQQFVQITNQLHIQMIHKYWKKAEFFAVMATDKNKRPMGQVIFIEFDF